MIDPADPELTVYGHLFNMSADKINRVINLETKRVERKPRKTGCLTEGLLLIATKIAELSAKLKAKKDLADKAKAPVVDSNLPSV